MRYFWAYISRRFVGLDLAYLVELLDSRSCFDEPLYDLDFFYACQTEQMCPRCSAYPLPSPISASIYGFTTANGADVWKCFWLICAMHRFFLGLIRRMVVKRRKTLISKTLLNNANHLWIYPLERGEQEWGECLGCRYRGIVKAATIGSSIQDYIIL